jgi:Fe-S-cluster containining protein
MIHDMKCRPGCGACCIAISISSPIPGMPEGKPAGRRCLQLTDQNLCALFGKRERPSICVSFKADKALCGQNPKEALANISRLEELTRF